MGGLLRFVRVFCKNECNNMVFWGSKMMFFEIIMGLLGFIIAEMDILRMETYILSETTQSNVNDVHTQPQVSEAQTSESSQSGDAS